MDDLKLLFVGDVVGKPGLEMVRTYLPSFVEKHKPDVIVVNAENVADGKGVTHKEASVLFELGATVLTGGNHTWDKHQSQDYIQKEPRALRPLNYPLGARGNGYYIHEHAKGNLAVISMQGRTFMPTIDCPFRKAEWALAKLKDKAKYVFIDFHAEATAEKIALAKFLDGKVSAVVGTHTHIQTSDERILPNGTGYITDAGMTGPYESVIGMKAQAAINRFIYQTPQKYETAKEDSHLTGVALSFDATTGLCNSIERIFFPEFEKTNEREANDATD
jgi:2',3'-cyclic-nucleotide 2'-phosphodiesterase